MTRLLAPQWKSQDKRSVADIGRRLNHLLSARAFMKSTRNCYRKSGLGVLFFCPVSGQLLSCASYLLALNEIGSCSTINHLRSHRKK